MPDVSSTPSGSAALSAEKSKAQSRSVSMQLWLWNLVEAEAARDRSGYLQGLALDDLGRKGLLPGQPAADLRRQIEELLATDDQEELRRLQAELMELAARVAARRAPEAISA